MTPPLRDRYELLARAGSGGEGEVYKALDHQHGRHVALKIRSAPSGGRRDDLLAEARMLLAMRPHSRVPLVRDDFFDGDRYVIVMDWIEGTDLAEVLESQGDPGLPAGSVLSYLEQAAEALDHLHTHDPPIVHGDVKPANLVLAADDRIVLVDFGVSSQSGALAARSLGTLGYVAPERAAGGPPTAASDIFSFAATAFALLTGTPPQLDVPSLEGVAPLEARALVRAIRRGLASDPARRPRRARELVERMRAHREGDLPSGTITFLLTDIQGSSRLWEQDPAAMARALARHDSIVHDAVEEFGGRLVKSKGEGDSTLSVFAGAVDALNAALGLQRVIGGEAWPGDLQIAVRCGLHTGNAELRDGDYFGPAVNRAARIRGAASGGQVLLSAATARLVEDSLPRDASLAELGSQKLQGLTRPEDVCQLLHPALRAAPQTPDEPAGSTTAFPGPLHMDSRSTFVGREAELARVHAAAARSTPASSIVIVTGEPGIGKTELVAEAARREHSSGTRVLYGRCDDDLDVAFRPFLEALSSLVTDGPAPPAAAAGELARLLPGLQVRDIEPTPDGTDERYRLFEAVADWLAAVASRPTLLVLDDLHWADRSTLSLLRHVVRRRLGGLTIVALYRDTDASPGLREVIDGLRQDSGAEAISLAGLPAIDIARIAGPAAEAGFADALTEQTGGSPLFTREVLAHFIETRQALRAEDLADAGVPEGVKAVVGRRVLRLGERAASVLRAASAAGREFELSVVSSVLAASEDDVLDVLDEAVSARLVSEIPGVPGRYSFSHALVQDALYESLTQTRRARLHKSIATAMVSAQYSAAEVASQFLRAGAQAARDAVDWSSRAAHDAATTFAFAEAATHYERALAALDDVQGATGAQRCTVLVAFGHASWSAGDFAKAREAFGRTVALATDPELLAEAALGLGGHMAGFGATDLDADLVRALERALAALPEGDSALRAMVAARLAEATAAGSRDTAAAPYREALAMARRVGHDRALAYVLVRAFVTIARPDNLDELGVLAREGIDAAVAAGDAGLVRDARLWRAVVLQYVGDYEESDREIRLATAASEELGEPYGQWILRLFEASRAHMRGRLDDAERLAVEALGIGHGSENPVAMQFFGVQLAGIRREQGRFGELEGPIDALIESLPAQPEAWLVARALLYAETGRHVEAVADLHAALESLPNQTDVGQPGTFAVLGETATTIGDREVSGWLYEQILPHARSFIVNTAASAYGSMQRPLGTLASDLERWDDAVEHCRHALVENERIGATLWVAHTRQQHARALLGRDRAGDHELAAIELGRALETARELRLVLLERRCLATQADL